MQLLLVLCLAVATQWALALAFRGSPTSIRDGWSVVLALCLTLSIPAAGLVWTSWSTRNQPASRILLLAIVVAGALMRAPYFGTGAMLEDDHFRYLLDGAMVANGLSPYAISPEALLNGGTGAPPGLVEAGRSAILAINFPELRSMYPGAAQALFGLAHLVAPWSIDGLRAVIFGAEALSAVLIWRVLVSTGRPPQLVALYWCNPLMAFCLTGQAHIDAALAPPILAALLAIHRRSAAIAGISLGIAVGVKLWPVLLAPLMARVLWPERRALLVFALTLGVATLAFCAPLFWASLSPNAGLAAYAAGWSVNNAPYAWTSYIFLHIIGPGSGEALLRALVSLTAVCASLAVAARRHEKLEGIVSGAVLVAATVFYLSPAQFPWYAAWFLPLAATAGSWPLVAASIGLPIYYLFFPLAIGPHRALHAYWFALLHLAPVLLLAILPRRASLSGAKA
jgi:hypothetical protein